MTKVFKGIEPSEKCNKENIKIEITETEEKKTTTSLSKINCDLNRVEAEITNFQTRLEDAQNLKILLEQDKISIQSEVDKITLLDD